MMIHRRFVLAACLFSLLFCPLLSAEEGNRPPGVIIDTSPDFPTTYVGSPTIAILPDGTYAAAHDWFGPNEKQHVTVTFVSKDKGKTWTKTAEFPFHWANLFVHKGDLYLMGVLKQRYKVTPGFSHLAIRKSTDGGRTWTEPMDSKTGLLRTDAPYHSAPCPIVEHNGRLWKGFETIMSGKKRDELGFPRLWGATFEARMLSVPVDADLLDAESWTVSEPFLYDFENWVGNGFLEGNAVLSPEGKIVNVLRVAAEGRDKGVILDVSEDGKKQTSRGKASQIDFPGGAVKFTVRFDPKSKRYWSLATQQKDPMATRNYLVLISSEDLIHWKRETVVFRHHDWRDHAWQYIDWVFEGENNIVFVSRTAWDGAHNNHDANYMTFHRIENFRDKSSKDDSPWLGKDVMKRQENEDYVIDGTFASVGVLQDGEKAFANRDYPWSGIPKRFRGWKFVRIDGGGKEAIRLTPKQDSVVYMIGPYNKDIPGWNHLEKLRAFYKVNGKDTSVSFYERAVEKDIRTDVHQIEFVGGIIIFKE